MMKNFKRFFTSLILLLVSFAVYAGGIKSAADLVAFAVALNGGQDVSAWLGENGIVCLENDIDMAKVKKFPAIATFGGVFDGQGYAIMNWKAQSGLIHEVLEGGVVQNLRIDASCSMKAQNRNGEYCVGWIADINNGTIRNCENHAQLSHKSGYTEHDLYIGGLVGSNRYVIYCCRNYGKITSACVGSKWGTEVVRLGGIAGGAYPNTVNCSTIARCENYGEVSYVGDVPYDRIGGIAGEMFKTTTKMCVNHGKVSSQSNPGIDGQFGESWVAGIVAYCKHDIICCDNFGEVSSVGSHKSHVSGIVSMPHTKLVIADCTNYGTVVAANENPSNVAGIAANIGREVHIVNGVNRGEILFKGSSPRHPSCAGGIVGNIYTTKTALTNVYLRRCVNYGKVESLSGGNNYANHDNAIHTGGVVGKALGLPAAKIRILDCANKGEVKAVTGRRGEVAGVLAAADVCGEWFDNNMATPASPLEDGSTIYGRVTDALGGPVAGCVVSDGKQCVATDDMGCYAMKSDMDDARFVFVSIPDGYKLTCRKSVLQNFRRIPRYQKAVSANFTLDKRTEPTDKYTVIMIGDPQMRGLGFDGSGERFRDDVLPDIEEYRKTTTGEFFAINLGDLVYNWMAGYDDYMDICAPLQYPMVNVIGNHDYDQFTILETELGTPYYEEYITPTYYSFNIGKIHYVVVNDIVYDRADHTKRYGAGLEDEQMKWLEEDLKFVPKNHMIYICGHAQLFKKKGSSPAGSYGRYNVNYDRYTQLLKQYKHVYSWSGHYHINYGFDYAGRDGYEDMGHVTAVSVARCNGALRSNMEIDNLGIPNGYMVVEVDGDNVQWFYKAVGRDKERQMTAYSPVRTGDGFVKANIWNYTEDYWGEVEWWENGNKVGTFERYPEVDPDYAQLHAAKLTHLTGTAATYAKPEPSDNMFRFKPSDGVTGGEIHVKDNFGVTYVEPVNW